jgi:peptide/nickel transport system permease protein
MRALHKTIALRLLRLVLLALAGGFLCATLVRFAPGYGVDERELDPRLSHESLERIRSEKRLNSNLISYYARYLSNALHGDFGKSEWLRQPVASLIKERIGVTARSVLLGVSIAWVLALCLSLASIFFKNFALDFSGALLSGFLIALPIAVVAILAVYLRAPVFAAIALVTFPKIFRYLRNLFIHAIEQPCILAARARGIGQSRIIFRHVLALSAPALLALLGISLSLAFGAAIPIEALCDSPGIGQLAWQSALNRDLPLISSLTLLVTLVTVAANSFTGSKQEDSM